MEIYCKEKGIPVPEKKDPLQAQRAGADEASGKEVKEEKAADKPKEEQPDKPVVMDFREVLTEGEEKLKESSPSDSVTIPSNADKQKADEEIKSASTEKSEDAQDPQNAQDSQKSQNAQDPDDANDFREV